MFIFKLLKYATISGISFNFWSLFWMIASKFPSLFSAYWALLIIVLLLNLGMMTEAAQEKLSDSWQQNKTDLAIANSVVFFMSIFAVIGSIWEVIF